MRYLDNYGDFLIKNERLPNRIGVNDDFQVLGYKIVMRNQVDIERGEHPSNMYEPHCHDTINNRIREWLESPNPIPDQYDFTFWPLYIMHYSSSEPVVNDERYVYYVGMTNSELDRFINHKHLKELNANIPPREDRKLHMCQLLVTYFHEGTYYVNIPIEWIFFEEDHGKKPRETLLNKIITFVETAALISPNTDKNQAYCIPNVDKNIYTGNLRIIDASNSDGISGVTFFANSSLHPNEPKVESEHIDPMDHLGNNTNIDNYYSDEDGGVVKGYKDEDDRVQDFGEHEELEVSCDDVSIFPEICDYLDRFPIDDGNNREYWTQRIYVNKHKYTYDEYMDFLENE